MEFELVELHSVAIIISERRFQGGKGAAKRLECAPLHGLSCWESQMEGQCFVFFSYCQVLV